MQGANTDYTGCGYAATGHLVCDAPPRPPPTKPGTERFYADGPQAAPVLDTGSIVQRVLAGRKAAIGR